MRVHIEVTAELIAAGVRGSPCDCPVGKAIYRAVGLDPDWDIIDVDGEGLHIWGRGNLRKASKRLPEVARQFIEDFDAGREVQPVEFDFTIFNWWLPRPRQRVAT